MSNKIKAVNIIGHNVNSKNNLPGVVTIGNKENGVTRESINEALNQKIGGDTIITINMHGNIDRNGNHYMDMNNSPIDTLSILTSIQKCAEGMPLQIDLRSCYSGNAKNYVKHLSEGSVLITNSKENSFSLFSNLEFSQFFKDYSMESNPYLRFLKMMFIKASSYSAFNTQLGKFEISPNHKVLLSSNSAKKFLEGEVEKFIKFSKDKFWGGTPVKLPSIKFSDEQIDIFVKNFFLYECSVNKDFYKFLEDHLSSNEYLKESINYSFDGGMTALYTASHEGDLDLVRVLINNGANIDIGDEDGATALHVASQEGHLKVVRLLLESGADVNKTRDDGLAALHMATKSGYTAVVNLLLEESADVNKVGDNSKTALFVASEVGNLELVKILLNKKYHPDVDKASKNGITALYAASQHGHTDVVKLLLKAGADVDKTLKNGETALHMASQNGHTDVVNSLLEAGANNDKAREDGTTALWIASYKGYVDVVKLLIHKKANIEKSDDDGVTPLWIASQQGHLEVVNSLLESGANKDKARDDGVSPLNVASYMGHTEVVNSLKKHIEELKSKSSDQENLNEDYYNDLFSHDSVGEDVDHTDEL